jgi:hypothetical protein
MEIEIRMEGAVLEGSIVPVPMDLKESMIPGRVLMKEDDTGDRTANYSYKRAVGLDCDWNPDFFATALAIKDMAEIPRLREHAEQIALRAKGDAAVERLMLLNLRRLGEPFAVSIERRLAMDGVAHWQVVGDPQSSTNESLLAVGLWVPDERLYEEMERLTLVHAAGEMVPLIEGQFAARIRGGHLTIFQSRADAEQWLLSHGKASMEAYSVEEEVQAMSRAAVDMATRALTLINAFARGETYTAIASLRRGNGQVTQMSIPGLLGRAAAIETLKGLVEMMCPTAFPSARLN